MTSNRTVKIKIKVPVYKSLEFFTKDASSWLKLGSRSNFYDVKQNSKILDKGSSL